MNTFFLTNALIISLIVIWTLPWKAWALWKAAKANDKIWFVVLLVVNVFGILEILYIFIFSKRERKEFLPVLTKAAKPVTAGDLMSFDDFSKNDLRVVKVVEAERVGGSDKLLKLKVDMGSEKRQIIAGIGKVYDTKDLVGKEIIIIANLEPRKLMGLESQGMLLAAGAEEGPVILMPQKEVKPGAKIR